MLSSDFKPSEEVLIENATADKFSGGQGSADLIQENFGQMKIHVSSQQGGWLYLSDTYYPGWKASVDGQETQLYKANYAFRAVKVAKGEHVVVFKYDPISRKIGAGISLLTLLTLISVIIFRKKISNWIPTLRYIKE